MSWDLFAQNFPDVVSIDDIPDEDTCAPLGERDALIARICQAFPDADFSDPTWGNLEREAWSIEINIGEEAVCTSFALHVRGSGEGAILAVAAILEATGVRALDAQTGKFFELEAAKTSFAEWEAWRDQIGS